MTLIRSSSYQSAGARLTGMLQKAKLLTFGAKSRGSEDRGYTCVAPTRRDLAKRRCTYIIEE